MGMTQNYDTVRMVLDSVCAAMWFILFCMIATDLANSTGSMFIENRATMNAAAAFSFFSTVSWIATTYMTNRRFRGLASGTEEPSYYEAFANGEGIDQTTAYQDPAGYQG